MKSHKSYVIIKKKKTIDFTVIVKINHKTTIDCAIDTIFGY